MVDAVNPSDTSPVVPDESRKGIAGFIATSSGRIIIAAVVLVVLLLAVGALVYLFVLQPSAPEDLVVVPPAGSVTTTTSAEATPVVPVYRRPKSLASMFVFRDIFVPTAKPRVESTATAGSSGTGGTSTTGGGSTTTTDTDGITVPADTLMLVSVSTADGEPVAKFIWNGQTFVAGEGDVLEGTPWKVLDISGTTVVLLYGDSRVTLSVGQGVSK